MFATSDYLNITVPVGEGSLVQHTIEPMLESVGGFQRCENLWDVNRGTVKFSTRGFVAITSLSGVVLAKLRAAELLASFLHAVAPNNPRVSTLDMFVDIPIAGADIVPALYARSRSSGVALTRKLATKIHALVKPGPDGRDTGTVYIGDRRTHDVSARVYDKQAERVEKGFADPGPCTRYELTVRGAVGTSLADVYDPTRLFYHFASPGLLTLPPGMPPWTPTPFERNLHEFRPYEEPMPYQRMKSLVESSADMQRLVKLAQSTSGGDALLLHLVRQALARGSGGATSSGHPTPLPPLESDGADPQASLPLLSNATTH